MELTGRITADAEIKKLTDGREVTGFTIAMNDQYRNKAGDIKKVTNFFYCSYWVSPKLVEHLKQGTIITVYGRIGLYPYIDNDGKPQASFNFHVNDIKFVAKASKGEAVVTALPAKSSSEPADDLPF